MELNFKVLDYLHELEGKTVEKVASIGWNNDYLVFKTINSEVLVLEGHERDEYTDIIEILGIKEIENNLKNDGEWMEVFSNLKLFDKDSYLKELEKQKEIKRKAEEERKIKNDLETLRELLDKYGDQI